MQRDFHIQALPIEPFAKFLSMDDHQLAGSGIRVIQVDAKPGFPCRVCLCDAEIGESVLALCHVHHATDSPYRASGPIFIRYAATPSTPAINEVPAMLRHRSLSLRGYDRNALMVHADTAPGERIGAHIAQAFNDTRVAYLHIHNAAAGCYLCCALPA